MLRLGQAVDAVVEAQRASGKPLAIILAGHNGSGKSTMWHESLAPLFRIPLINADRLMMSILPEPTQGGQLVRWAQDLRDTDANWMRVAQSGVQAFVAQALTNKVSFAFETVFSHWRQRPDGTFESKIDQIVDMQEAGYFVILFFVGLTSSVLSIARVATRTAQGGHAVPLDKLISRFPRTQQAIREAAGLADATIMVDNSRTTRQAFTVCRVQMGQREVFDRRRSSRPMSRAISAWIDIVAPLPAAG